MSEEGEQGEKSIHQALSLTAGRGGIEERKGKGERGRRKRGSLQSCMYDAGGERERERRRERWEKGRERLEGSDRHLTDP